MQRIPPYQITLVIKTAPTVSVSLKRSWSFEEVTTGKGEYEHRGFYNNLCMVRLLLVNSMVDTFDSGCGDQSWKNSYNFGYIGLISLLISWSWLLSRDRCGGKNKMSNRHAKLATSSGKSSQTVLDDGGWHTSRDIMLGAGSD